MERGTKRPFYKKWWVWVIAVIVLIAIIPTDDEEDVSTSSENVASEHVDSQSEDELDIEPEESIEEELEDIQTEYVVNEPIEFESRIITITDVEYSQGSDFDTPSDGKEYVIVTVSIENISDDEISYNPFHFDMRNSQGQIEGQSFSIVDSDTALSPGDLAPGGNVSGTLVFEQPIDDDDLTLLFEPSFWSGDRIEIKLN